MCDLRDIASERLRVDAFGFGFVWLGEEGFALFDCVGEDLELGRELDLEDTYWEGLSAFMFEYSGN